MSDEKLVIGSPLPPELVAYAMNMLQKEDKFANMVGLKITDVRVGHVKGELELREMHRNPIGSVHGGCIYTMVDSLGGFCSGTMGNAAPTTNSDLYFLGNTIQSKKLFGEAKVKKAGKRLRVIEVTVTDDRDKLIASGTFQYMDLGKNVTGSERPQV